MIDGSASGFMRSVKLHISENSQYENIILQARQRFGSSDYENKLHLYMTAVPINFSTKGRAMLESLRKRLDMGKIACDPEAHKELLTELRIAQSDENMKLIKENPQTMDLIHCVCV